MTYMYIHLLCSRNECVVVTEAHNVTVKVLYLFMQYDCDHKGLAQTGPSDSNIICSVSKVIITLVVY